MESFSSNTWDKCQKILIEPGKRSDPVGSGMKPAFAPVHGSEMRRTEIVKCERSSFKTLSSGFKSVGGS
ncbi:MAG: hypothetical protein CVU57_18060 [Deltaproteobacteria bacterium HGW-Deltaproteobacteria-15]|jgi:hypothetical protein|nr:MAG: hypothetical protein CVU57_18060 [Deltaproteobacteria bacterium HGW-Deltaproteobacteria-15]